MKVSLFHTETGDMSSPFWGKNKTKQNIAQAKNFCATEDSYLTKWNILNWCFTTKLRQNVYSFHVIPSGNL